MAPPPESAGEEEPVLLVMFVTSWLGWEHGVEVNIGPTLDIGVDTAVTVVVGAGVWGTAEVVTDMCGIFGVVPPVVVVEADETGGTGAPDEVDGGGTVATDEAGVALALLLIGARGGV